MKRLFIIILSAAVACNNPQTAAQQEQPTADTTEAKSEAIPLNNGAKWKADSATLRNVAAMAQVLNDSTYANSAKSKELYTALQANVDKMIKECRMQGPDHDALHVWLEKLMKDLKELQEEDDEYSEAYEALKKDIVDFYQTFE